MISRSAVSCGALALVGAAFGQAPSAASVVVNASIPYTDTNWSQSLVIPHFKVPSAHLDSVEIAFLGDVKSSIKLENRDEESIDYTASASYVLNLKGLSGNTLLMVKPVIAPRGASWPLTTERSTLRAPRGCLSWTSWRRRPARRL